MSRNLITTSGATRQPSNANLEAQLRNAAKEGFWLDIESPDEQDLSALDEVFHFHHLTIEDVKHRNQRPKLEEYSGYSFAVIFTAAWSTGGINFSEHHVYLGPHFIVTVHDKPAPELTELLERVKSRPEITRNAPSFLTYMVIDTLIDSNFPTLEHLDDAVDRLQEDMLERTHPDLLKTIYSLKHDITDLRRLLSAQRGMFQRLISHSLELQEGDMTVYWRDVYDHILRQYESVESLRDLLYGAMDVYLSTVSNRTNSTTKTLTVIASLFLPLTWLTGFYGMNFTYLTGTLETHVWTFWVGVATMLALLGVQVYMFRRRGWI